MTSRYTVAETDNANVSDDDLPELAPKTTVYNINTFRSTPIQSNTSNDFVPKSKDSGQYKYKPKSKDSKQFELDLDLDFPHITSSDNQVRTISNQSPPNLHWSKIGTTMVGNESDKPIAKIKPFIPPLFHVKNNTTRIPKYKYRDDDDEEEDNDDEEDDDDDDEEEDDNDGDKYKDSYGDYQISSQK